MRERPKTKQGERGKSGEEPAGLGAEKRARENPLGRKSGGRADHQKKEEGLRILDRREARANEETAEKDRPE